MKARFLWAMAIVLVLLSLPAVVLAQPPITPSAEIPGDGVGAAPLGSPDALWDQPIGSSWGVASQYFVDYGQGAYSADDFSNASPWVVESILVDGFVQVPDGLIYADSLHWLIYPDAAGKPASYPGCGGELWSYTCLPTDPEVTIGGSWDGQVTLDIVQAQGTPLHLPPGTYWLCFYPSLNTGYGGMWYWFVAGTTNLAPAQFIDPTNFFGTGWTSWTPWINADPTFHDLAFRLEGYVPPPPNVKYLHSTGGLFNLTDPVDTQWHELWPIFCREYHLSSWNDTGGDDILSYCDQIDMYEKPDGELRPYHVENVTITLVVTPAPMGNNEHRATVPPPQGNELPQQPMYIELVGGFNETALGAPIGTLWHEIYPNFCTAYNLTGWDDNTNGVLDFCDSILLEYEGIKAGGWWHVEEVAIDIIVTPEPPPVGGEAYPVNKASLLAPWIAVGVVLAGGIGWCVLRRRKAQS